MNESSALNTETRLPRQVKAQADKARALLSPNPDQPAPVTPPAPSEPGAPPAADPRDNDPVYWKQRFKVTEGMWRRDKTRWEEERRALEQQLEASEARVRELESKGGTDEINLEEFFTAEEIEQLGEPQARIQAKAIKQQAARIAKELVDREVKPLKERSERAAQDAREEREAGFVEALTELVPHWQEVNKDSRWLDWLSEDDENTGIWRQTILDHHTKAGNAAKVAEMIRAWESSLNAARVPGEPNVHAPSGRSGAGGPPAQEVPVTNMGPPSKQEIRDFYKRKALGKVTEEQARQFDARLKAAGMI